MRGMVGGEDKGCGQGGRGGSRNVRSDLMEKGVEAAATQELLCLKTSPGLFQFHPVLGFFLNSVRNFHSVLS